MNMMTSVAAIAAATPLAHASQTEGDDAELITLAEQIKEARKQVDEADARCAVCDEVFNRIQPPWPAAFRWRLGDPVSFTMEHLEGGKCRLWCNIGEVSELKGREFWNYAFVGTDEDWKRLGLVSFEGNPPEWPIAGQESLWERWPDEGRQRRAQELYAAWLEWSVAEDRARHESGLAAADDAADAASEVCSSLFNRMLELTPSRIDGYRAFATGILWNCWGGEISQSEGAARDKKALYKMVSGLTGVPVQASH